MALGTKIHFTLNYEIKTCLIRKLGQCLIVNFPDWYVAPWSCQSSHHFGSVELLGPGAWNYRMSVWNDCENLFILPERWGISPLTIVWNWLIPIKRCSLFFYSVTESFWTCEKGAKTSRFHEQPLCHFIIPCETIWKNCYGEVPWLCSSLEYSGGRNRPRIVCELWGALWGAQNLRF